ncbi:hypothetical protein BASA83_013828 [Batrachochytrium salamandrivorans]|nr:hypothetical protein BASA83_013828 [Batrachochytrium salamandrivorans]
MFGPALTLVLALASSAVIASPTVDNVYKRAVASLTLRPLLSHSISLNLSMRTTPTVVLSHFPPPKRMMSRLRLTTSPKSSSSARTISRCSTPSLILLVSPMLWCTYDQWFPYCQPQASIHVKNGKVTSFSSSLVQLSTFPKAISQ